MGLMRSRPLMLALFAASLASMAAPREAAANMARAVTEGERFGALVPRKDTTVRVDRETLSFDLAPDLGSAKVVATYRMTSAEVNAIEVAFVIVDGSAQRDKSGEWATVTIDGAPSPFRTVRSDELPAPRAEIDATMRAWSTLGTPERLTWLVFPIDFKAGQTREVSVAYKHSPSEDRAEHVNDTYGYDYLLSPAKAWPSFGPIDITVRVPDGTSIDSNIPLTRQGDTHRAALPGLPSGELQFTATSRRGLWFGMTTSTGYWIITILALMGAAIAAGRATGKLWLRRSSILRVIFGGPIASAAAALVAVVLSALMPNRALGFGYGGILGLMFLILLAAPVGIIASFVAARRQTF